MNKTTGNGHDAMTPEQAREWDVQERARLAARAGSTAGDDETQAYRRIAQALRTAPPERLPSNFAWQVAQAAARLPRAGAPDLRLETWLLRMLAVAMGVGAIVVSVAHGAAWLRALDAAGSGVAAWAAALALCMLLSWGMQSLRLQRRA